jgi:hypothetical protein
MEAIDIRSRAGYLTCTFLDYLLGDGVHQGWLDKQGYVISGSMVEGAVPQGEGGECEIAARVEQSLTAPGLLRSDLIAISEREVFPGRLRA